MKQKKKRYNKKALKIKLIIKLKYNGIMLIVYINYFNYQKTIIKKYKIIKKSS